MIFVIKHLFVTLVNVLEAISTKIGSPNNVTSNYMNFNEYVIGDRIYTYVYMMLTKWYYKHLIDDR